MAEFCFFLLFSWSIHPLLLGLLRLACKVVFVQEELDCPGRLAIRTRSDVGSWTCLGVVSCVGVHDVYVNIGKTKHLYVRVRIYISNHKYLHR